jgi:acetyl-CoA synthetase
MYFTYDEALEDQDGHFWVLGRTDDVINVAGHRISTMEIESAIMHADGVAEVAVVGETDAIKGLVPVAFVTLKQDMDPSCTMKERIHEEVARTIGRIAVPKEIYFTQEMPKTPSGKILRRLLRELITKGEVKSDTSGLEDLSTLERLKQTLSQRKD